MGFGSAVGLPCLEACPPWQRFPAKRLVIEASLASCTSHESAKYADWNLLLLDSPIFTC